MRRILLLLPFLWLALAVPVPAQTAAQTTTQAAPQAMTPAQQALGARASVTGVGLGLIERRGRVLLSLDLTQPVPWRVFTLDDPWRVVMDFSEVDWTGVGAPSGLDEITRVEAIATGTFRPGWSRLVIELTRPLDVAQAGMETTPSGARISLRLTDTDAASFAAKAGAPPSAVFSGAETLVEPARPADDRFTVVLDPGHGGIDPGAEREGVRESDLVLTFARELRDELRRADAAV
ncbi:MAG: N-acetylmuramoyl-L-alanine amidase, partial [Maritimibacter sp.]|nr:N-acetylmuramoyl-L-alanine amidase [Maritimibacter sp.]